MLPVKVIVCLIAGIFLYFHEKGAGADIVYRYQLSLYGIGNLMFLYLLLQGGQIKLNYLAVKISAYFLSLIDNLFLCYLIYFSGGEESLLFWFYCALLVRNAANFPSFIEQSILNIMFLFFYVGVLFLAQDRWNFLVSELFITRIVLLIVVSFCGWNSFSGKSWLFVRRNFTRRRNWRPMGRMDSKTLAGSLITRFLCFLKDFARTRTILWCYVNWKLLRRKSRDPIES